jgi:hypothetical protein
LLGFLVVRSWLLKKKKKQSPISASSCHSFLVLPLPCSGVSFVHLLAPFSHSSLALCIFSFFCASQSSFFVPVLAAISFWATPFRVSGSRVSALRVTCPHIHCPLHPRLLRLPRSLFISLGPFVSRSLPRCLVLSFFGLSSVLSRFLCSRLFHAQRRFLIFCMLSSRFTARIHSLGVVTLALSLFFRWLPTGFLLGLIFPEPCTSLPVGFCGGRVRILCRVEARALTRLRKKKGLGPWISIFHMNS